MPNWIQKNMGMITMVAAVISVLILALPIIGVNLLTKEGGNEPIDCVIVSSHNIVGFDVSQCGHLRMMYPDCHLGTNSYRVTQGAYKDEIFNTGGGCPINEDKKLWY